MHGDEKNNAWSIGAVHDAMRHQKRRTPLAGSAVHLVVQYTCSPLATHHEEHKPAHATLAASSMLDGMPRHMMGHAQLAVHAAWYAASCILHPRDMRIGLARRSVVCPTCLHWMVMISVVFYLCFDTCPALCIEGISLG